MEVARDSLMHVIRPHTHLTELGGREGGDPVLGMRPRRPQVSEQLAQKVAEAG